MDELARDSAIASGIESASIFDLLPDAWLILNERAEVVMANAAYLQSLQAVLPNIQGRSVYEINQAGSAEQRDARRVWIDDALTGLVSGEMRISPILRYDMRSRNPAANGTSEMRFWQINTTRIEPGDGREPLIALRVNDVTDTVEAAERSQRERAKLRSQARLRQVLMEEANALLRDNQEQLRLALAFAQIGAWEFDASTGRVDCTEQCRACLGLPVASELSLARFFNELIDDADRARVRSVVVRALKRREHFEIDFRVVWPDGTTHWALVRGVGRYQPDGGVKSVLGFTLDITPRKEAELEQRAIAQSEKRARVESEQIARAMDHFVTAVSHELRSPLGAILSWCTLLQRAGDMSHVERASGVIERNARQLAHMVDDLLDSGAIATGKLSVDRRPVDLAALAGIVAEDTRIGAQAKGVQLITDDLSPCAVLADESRMKQIVWNLLSNAVKFCVEGTVELTVAQRGDMHAELTVRDTGCGIEPDALGRIFDRFEQQVKAVSSGRVAGLGLGLWLVKHLVELHDGTIVAESAGRGQGATFRVTLPLYRRA
ncbi:sensor histidine kinase [Paraburkholderia phosphatilytica]|uniref:sensor histidine kinase n=1 Tax=Paraburkholderia phosphatilytica TaxID=2282883 RepID=UPI000E4A0AE2|nr:ATP-binding protein [Paraburkholderia phosphatilytica]